MSTTASSINEDLEYQSVSRISEPRVSIKEVHKFLRQKVQINFHKIYIIKKEKFRKKLAWKLFSSHFLSYTNVKKIEIGLKKFIKKKKKL